MPKTGYLYAKRITIQISDEGSGPVTVFRINEDGKMIGPYHLDQHMPTEGVTYTVDLEPGQALVVTGSEEAMAALRKFA